MKKSIYILFLITVIKTSWAQENNTVSSMLLYDRHPVDIYTGTPDINIPIYTIPTRDKGLSVNISFSYHPSGISVYNENMSNASKGWNFKMLSGVIYRTGSFMSPYVDEITNFGMIDELRWTTYSSSHDTGNLYEYNVLHLKGKFKIDKDGSNFDVTVIEDGGEPVEIEVNYNFSSNTIDSFKIYDTGGRIYNFTVADTRDFKTPDNDIFNFKNAFHLSSIEDANAQQIITVDYVDNSYIHYGKNYKYNFLKSIISNGFGKVDFNLTIPSFLSNNFKVRYNYLDVYDYLDNHILKTEYNGSQDKLIKSVTGVLNDEVYRFKYKAPPPILFPETHDYWGYPKADKCTPYSQGRQADKDMVTKGVLQQIIYPLGGSIIYDFESHTYSNPLGSDDSGFYTNLDYLQYYQHYDYYQYLGNLYNFQLLPKGKPVFGPSQQGPFFFTVPQTMDYFFKPEETAPYYAPELSPELDGYVYPVFTIKKGSTIIGTIGLNSDSENYCLGKRFTLTAGEYSISMSYSYLTTGRIRLYTLEQNEVIKKYWYGGGVRIKRIAYFDTEVPNDYYDLSSPEISPVREINYSYNFFNDNMRSSGHLRWFEPGSDVFKGHSLVHYKNVTVTENSSLENGKTEYVFFSPIDAGYWKDPRYGFPLKQSVYDKSNNLIAETIMECDQFNVIENPNDKITFFPNYNINDGWVKPSNILKKIYSESNVLETSSDLFYNHITKKMYQNMTATSISGITESKKYFYHTLNSAHSKNRCQLERVESYTNSNLVHTSRVIYSNVWPVLAEDGIATNVAYLPLRTESSKNGTDYKIVSKVNLYDRYSNIVEYENEQGTRIVNIWGYNKTKIVAKIENISYSQVSQSLITAIQTASNGSNESSLLTALNNLRNHSSLANSLVTTYTYKPLIGISTETDYRGRRTSYYYDGFGRLKEVRDHNNNILSEKEYYYQN